LFAVILFCLDHLTKWLAIEYLKPHPPYLFFNDLARLQYAENSGAFLGMGSDLSPHLRLIIFSVLVGVVLIYFTYNLWRELKDHYHPRLHIAQTAIVSGGFANLVDRIFRESHAVVDFMNVGIGPHFRTGIFNIADMAILFGFIAIILKPDDLLKKAASTPESPQS